MNFLIFRRFKQQFSHATDAATTATATTSSSDHHHHEMIYGSSHVADELSSINNSMNDATPTISRPLQTTKTTIKQRTSSQPAVISSSTVTTAAGGTLSTSNNKSTSVFSRAFNYAASRSRHSNNSNSTKQVRDSSLSCQPGDIEASSSSGNNKTSWRVKLTKYLTQSSSSPPPPPLQPAQMATTSHQKKNKRTNRRKTIQTSIELNRPTMDGTTTSYYPYRGPAAAYNDDEDGCDIVLDDGIVGSGDLYASYHLSRRRHLPVNSNLTLNNVVTGGSIGPAAAAAATVHTSKLLSVSSGLLSLSSTTTNSSSSQQQQQQQQTSASEFVPAQMPSFSSYLNENTSNLNILICIYIKSSQNVNVRKKCYSIKLSGC